VIAVKVFEFADVKALMNLHLVWEWWLFLRLLLLLQALRLLLQLLESLLLLLLGAVLLLQQMLLSLAPAEDPSVLTIASRPSSPLSSATRTQTHSSLRGVERGKASTNRRVRREGGRKRRRKGRGGRTSW
jgi:hypothetical protein